jgi:hypothetical protein
LLLLLRLIAAVELLLLLLDGGCYGCYLAVARARDDAR